MGFREGFGNSLAGFAYMQDQADQGTVRRKANSLAQLAGDYAAGGQPDYQGIAANGGDPMAYRNDAQKRVGEFASLLVSAPPQMRPSIYAKIQPQLAALGLQAPPEYSPEIDGMAQQIAQQFGGGSQGSTGVQSSFVDASGQRMAIMRDGSVRPLGQNAPNNQIIDTGNGFVGVNKGNLQAAPVTIGQGPQAPPPGTNDTLIATANQMVAAGVPDEFVQKWMSQQPGIGPASDAPQGATMQAPTQMGYGSGQQLRSAPKAPAAPSPETFSQPQTVLGPDGKPRLVQFGNQGGQRTPEGVAPAPSASDSRSSATALRQVNAAKAKLIDLQSVKAQLALVQQKFAPLQNSASAGPFGQGYLPTEDGRRYDAAVSLLQQQVRKLTRTPGEGSMSDWEGKLDMLANPGRNDYESVTQDKIDQLNSLVSQIEQGYTAIMDDNSGAANPKAPAAAGSVIRYDAQGNRIK